MLPFRDKLSMSLPGPRLDFRVTAEKDAGLVTTCMPEAEFSVTYYKSVPQISGAAFGPGGSSLLDRCPGG